MEELGSTEMIDKVYVKCPYPKEAVATMYRAVLEVMEEEFIKGNSIKFPGICVFSIKEYHKKGPAPVFGARGSYMGKMAHVDTIKKHLRIKETRAMRDRLNKEAGK